MREDEMRWDKMRRDGIRCECVSCLLLSSGTKEHSGASIGVAKRRRA